MESTATHFKSLKLKNYRLFEEREFAFNPCFTVLIGQNATGKSTALDALRMALVSYVRGFYHGFAHDEQILEADVRGKVVHHKGAPSTIERFTPSEVCGKMDIFGELHDFSFSRGGSPDERQTYALPMRANAFNKMLQGSDTFILPIFVYYGVSRASRLITARSTPMHAGLASRTIGYQDCLSASLNPANFAEWLKKATYISLQEGAESDQMRAVVDAIRACLPEVENIAYRVKEDAVIVSFGNGASLPFNNLSDGYRSVMALTADIAYRMATLNPHLEGKVAEATPGVVLIDELDLHLHPAWQRRIVGDLKRAFPLIQFITTTHSPFIIQSLEPGEVLDLGRKEPVDTEFSKLSIEDVAEEIMDVHMPQRSKRYQDMYDTAAAYFALLDQSANASDAEKSALEEKLDALSEPFSDDVAYYAFLNSKRIAAGVSAPREKKQ